LDPNTLTLEPEYSGPRVISSDFRSLLLLNKVSNEVD